MPKVMFSVVSVRHSAYWGGPYVAITYDALDLTLQGRLHPHPNHPLPTWDLRTSLCYRHLVATTGDLFKLVTLWPPNWCWYLMVVEGVNVSASRQYASYWNTFLFPSAVNSGAKNMHQNQAITYCYENKSLSLKAKWYTRRCLDV